MKMTPPRSTSPWSLVGPKAVDLGMKLLGMAIAGGLIWWVTIQVQSSNMDKDIQSLQRSLARVEAQLVDQSREMRALRDAVIRLGGAL